MGATPSNQLRHLPSQLPAPPNPTRDDAAALVDHGEEDELNHLLGGQPGGGGWGSEWGLGLGWVGGRVVGVRECACCGVGPLRPPLPPTPLHHPPPPPLVPPPPGLTWAACPRRPWPGCPPAPRSSPGGGAPRGRGTRGGARRTAGGRGFMGGWGGCLCFFEVRRCREKKGVRLFKGGGRGVAAFKPPTPAEPAEPRPPPKSHPPPSNPQIPPGPPTPQIPTKSPPCRTPRRSSPPASWRR